MAAKLQCLLPENLCPQDALLSENAGSHLTEAAELSVPETSLQTPLSLLIL